MMGAGIQLMVLGMSVVIVFLIVLVLFMGLAAAMVRRFAPQAAESDAADAAVRTAGGHNDAAGETRTHRIAAVLAAVAMHHRRRRTSTTSQGEHR